MQLRKRTRNCMGWNSDSLNAQSHTDTLCRMLWSIRYTPHSSTPKPDARIFVAVAVVVVIFSFPSAHGILPRMRWRRRVERTMRVSVYHKQNGASRKKYTKIVYQWKDNIFRFNFTKTLWQLITVCVCGVCLFVIFIFELLGLAMVNMIRNMTGHS